MSSLPRTSKKYGTHCWNWLTGCANGPGICKTEDKFLAKFPRKPGARILVCFTGDISYASPVDINRAFARILCHPEHTFILLTKRPKEAYRDIEWPANTWLGVSLTGAESVERQQQVIDELRAVKGQHKRWVSYD